MNKTKIEWAFGTWNPVWGCKNKCQYCYARKYAKRFAKKMAELNWVNCLYYNLDYYDNRESEYAIQDLKNDLENFRPTFLESNFNKKFPKNPSNIFVNSMSDIAYWEPEWIETVLNKIKKYPQHNFLFLTKSPQIYEEYRYLWAQNCWLGTTITTQQQMNNFASMLFDTTFDDKNKIFVSLEPLQEEIKMYVNFDWVIVGAETGNRKNKIVPKVEWIEEIRKNCDKNNIPYFEKDSIKKIVDRDLIQQYPEKLGVNLNV